MNGKDVMDALANIDDDLILDAKSQPRAIPRWLKWGSMAVCICCAVLLTLLCVEKLRSGGENVGIVLASGVEETTEATSVQWELQDTELLLTYDTGTTATLPLPEALQNLNEKDRSMVEPAISCYLYEGFTGVFLYAPDGEGTFAGSYDYGASWQQSSIWGVSDVTSSVLVFTSQEHGWLLLEGNVGGQTAQHTLLTTEDGGETWAKQDLASQVESRLLGYANFLSDTEGYISVGEGLNVCPMVYATFDGGSTWTACTMPDSISEGYLSVERISMQEGDCEMTCQVLGTETPATITLILNYDTLTWETAETAATAIPAETEFEISLDSQGNLTCIQWGTPLTEAQDLFPEAALSEDTLSVTGTFFDFPVTLSLQFSQVSWSDEPILYGAAMIFSEEADLDRLSEEMDQLFGPVETQGETQNGETYDLQEADYYWHGSGYVYELVDTDSLQAYISVQGEGSSWLDYILRTTYPVTITLARENYTLNLDAKYAVELEQIETATNTETAPTTSHDLEEAERTTITDAVFGLSIEVPVEYQEDIVCNDTDTVLFSFYDPISNAAMEGDGGGFVWSICAYPIEEADLYVGDDLCPTDGIRLIAPSGFVLGQNDEYVFAVILPSDVRYLPDVAESKSSYQKYCKAGCSILASFLTCNGITGSDGWEEHYMDPVNARDGM
jgi:hypothetical protein